MKAGSIHDQREDMGMDGLRSLYSIIFEKRCRTGATCPSVLGETCTNEKVMTVLARKGGLYRTPWPSGRCLER